MGPTPRTSAPIYAPASRPSPPDTGGGSGCGRVGNLKGATPLSPALSINAENWYVVT
jgi:hypothetical protein